MKQIVEYLLSKSNVKDIKQSYYAHFKEMTKNINDENFSNAIEDLYKLPEDHKEALFEMLCKFYDEKYKFESKNTKHKIKNTDKIVKIIFSMGQTSILIFNMCKRSFSAVFVWPRENEIDWYLSKDVNINRLHDAYDLDMFSLITKKYDFQYSWLLNEKYKINMIQNIFDETK